MNTCNKRCIANVGGQCAVPECRGEIRSTGRKQKTLEKAACAYEMAKDAFDDEYLQYLLKSQRR